MRSATTVRDGMPRRSAPRHRKRQAPEAADPSPRRRRLKAGAALLRTTPSNGSPERPTQSPNEQVMESLQKVVTEQLVACITSITEDSYWLPSSGHICIGYGEEGPLKCDVAGWHVRIQARLKVVYHPRPLFMVQYVQVEPRGRGIGPLFFRALLHLLRTRSIATKDDSWYKEGVPRLLVQQVAPPNQGVYEAWHGRHFLVTRMQRHGAADFCSDVDYWIDPLAADALPSARNTE